jgi:hypothetical protein
VEGTSAPVHTRSTPHGPWEACQPSRRGQGSGTGGCYVGHRPPSAPDTRSPPEPSPWDEQGPCQSRLGQGASTTEALARTGMCPPVVRPCGHRPQRGLHDPAGGRVACQPHSSRRRVAGPSEPRPVPPARSGPRRDPEVMAPMPSQRSRFVTSIGRAAAPVWCNPRRREAAERNPRASSAAGTGRRPVRWYPTHGYQQAQPTEVTGSGSSDRPCLREGITLVKRDENFSATS